MTGYDPDAAARRALARHRAIATALLLLMAALTLGSYALPQDHYATQLLQAAAKAGFVGGIADWFAVTALFRHPLGLPIPHTAILPAQKERLGRALGRFVSTHVFTQAEVSRTLARLDLPDILGRYLSDPAAARPLARSAAGLLPRLLGMVQDGRARRVLSRLLPRLVGGPAAGLVVARALRGLTASGRHQDVLTFLLDELRATLAAKEGQLRAMVEERVREQGGRLIGWVLGASIATRVLTSVNAELAKIGPEGSELRAAFDVWVEREISRMETDPKRAAEIGRALRRLATNEVVQTWLWDAWSRLRVAVEADAARPGGHTATFLEGTLANLGGMLAADPGAREGLQRGLEAIARTVLPAAQTRLADFIAKVVAGWDTATLTERLELRVGKDLQYVRMNGTLVGFLVGGLLYAVLRAVFGHVSF